MNLEPSTCIVCGKPVANEQLQLPDGCYLGVYANGMLGVVHSECWNEYREKVNPIITEDDIKDLENIL